jgi:hypothetical protein
MIDIDYEYGHLFPPDPGTTPILLTDYQKSRETGVGMEKQRFPVGLCRNLYQETQILNP